MLSQSLLITALAALTATVGALPDPRHYHHNHLSHVARQAGQPTATRTYPSASASGGGDSQTDSSNGAGLSRNSTSTKTSSGFQNVVYWGQGTGERDLAAYCDDSEGIDVIVLAFISSFGTQPTPSGNFGGQCATSQAGCLEDAVKKCKAAGKKIIVSLGGAAGSYGFADKDSATKTAKSVWDMFGKPSGNSQAARPLGQQTADGFDIDVESNDSASNENYQYFISALRDSFKSDSAGSYVITGAPQCPWPEPNMGKMIGEAKFDMLFIQFYNNPACSANNGDTSGINFSDWAKNLQGGPSADAKLFLGLPGSPTGATGTDSGSKYFVQPSDLVGLVKQYKDQPAFGGVMMWDAAQSDKSQIGGCSYAQNAKSILTKGKAC
ncbi:MAG: hypothetical protein Q9162_002323 [Coniocarpon cinnabarinum]